MLYRELGTSGIRTSAIGLGAWAIGGWMWGGSNEDDAVRAIHTSLDHGVNLVDTAPAYGYGRSEEIVGKAIRGRRDQVIIATKCGLIWDREEGEFFFHANEKGITPGPSEKKIYKCLRPDSIRRELQQSLKRLGTDHIDLYQTHWQEATTPLADTVAALQRLKEEGKIRAIGVSNCNLDQLRAYGPIASDQEKYSMLDRGIEHSGILEYCRRANVALLAYSPLANGLLTGKITPERRFGEGDLRRMNPRFGRKSITRVNAMIEQLRPIAQRHGASMSQIVVAWTFSQPGITCVLCGARNAEQAEENARAGEIALSADQIEAVNKILQAHAAA